MSLEDKLAAILDMHQQSFRQHSAEQADIQRGIDERHARLRRQHEQFAAVREMIQSVAEQANTYLATRPEKCRLCDVSGKFTGRLHPSGCNPAAFQLLVDGREVGELLVVELTSDAMVDACLGDPGMLGSIGFGWAPVPITNFSMQEAEQVFLQYLNYVTRRWQFAR